MSRRRKASTRRRSGVLVGGEVAFDPLPQRLGNLLLARAGAVGEELSFLVVCDEDGLGYCRRHVALEEHSGGERVGVSRGDGSRTAGCWQGREVVEQGGGKELSVPGYVTRGSIQEVRG
jgi:hypothetical protein